MLVLSRKVGEEIIIDGCIRVIIKKVKFNQVSIGIEAPRDVPVYRQELIEKEHDADVYSAQPVHASR